MGAHALSALLWIGAALAGGAAGYLWAWALAGLVLRPRRATAGAAHTPQFVIIIPAHNEAARLPALLESLTALDYPRDRYAVWVVADNCTDGTAEVARRAGVRCLRRNDAARPGKGQALQYAFSYLQETDADAAVVLDADSLVNPGLLSAFAAAWPAGAGACALQASSRLRPEGSAQALLLAAESALEDRFFYGSKGRAGFPVLLRGGGMCLSAALLHAHPWQAGSAGEDVEYSASLLRSGIAPQFVEAARVTSPAPVRRDQFVVQRTRWGVGHQQVARRHGLPLLWQGLRTHNLRLCDAGIGFFVTSKAALLAVSAVVAAAGWLARGLVGLGPARLASGAVAALAAYGLLGVAWCRPSLGQLARAAVAAPGLVLLRVWMHLRGLLRRGPLSWQRTPE